MCLFLALTACPPQVLTATAADGLPANALRVYVHFNRRMTRGELDRVSLWCDSTPIAEPFLDEELWDGTGTRLTLILHPGRVKGGIASSPGPVLEAGKRHTLRIAAGWPDGGGKPAPGFERTFLVGPAVTSALDPAGWQITATPAGVAVRFDRMMDPALLVRMLAVDGVPGRGEATAGGRGWRFTPARPMAPGGYTLTAPAELEDVCGNRPGRAFEAPPAAAESRPVRVRFTVRTR
jgi:hypothetical protein